MYCRAETADRGPLVAALEPLAELERGIDEAEIAHRNDEGFAWQSLSSK